MKELIFSIINSHANNRGDEAAQKALILMIRKEHPGCRFNIFTNNPSALFEMPGIAVKRSPVISKKGILAFIAALNRVRKGIKGDRRNSFDDLLYAIKESSIVISSPGGPYIGDLYTDHEISEHLFSIFCAHLLKKPVMIYGPSMGPFNRKFRNMIRRHILGRCRAITVRDGISMEHLRSLKLKGPLTALTADSAFQVPVAEFSQASPANTDLIGKGNSLKIGFTAAAAAWNFRMEKNKEELEEKYVNNIAAALDAIIERTGGRIICFPQLYGAEEDLVIHERIGSSMKNPGNYGILPKTADSDEQQKLIAGLDLFIGNRYHSLIFALKNTIPCLAVSYEHKTDDLMARFGMSGYCVKAAGLTEGLLTERFLALAEKAGDIKKAIASALEKTVDAAGINHVFAEKLIREAVEKQ